MSQCEHQTLTKVSQVTLCEYKASQKEDVKKHIESDTDTPLSLPLQ